MTFGKSTDQTVWITSLRRNICAMAAKSTGKTGPSQTTVVSFRAASQLPQTGHSVRRAALFEEPTSVEIDKAGVCGAAFNCPRIFCLEFNISAYYMGTHSSNRPLK
ncbi:hypothetical protein [Leisingera methylohalidivorans]|uniref:hypothetical protein n=1 Tax=Leisingera methylohalidivorans TaxID=133924 RepID=UPI0012EB2514|nr:hypothetical protein [Leisingera methylohalidivorans]